MSLLDLLYCKTSPGTFASAALWLATARLLVGMLLRSTFIPCFCTWQQSNLFGEFDMKLVVFEAVSGWPLPLSLAPDCQL